MSQEPNVSNFTFGFIGLGPISQVLLCQLMEMFPTEVDFILYDRYRTEIEGVGNVTMAKSPLEVAEKSLVMFVRYFDSKLVYKTFCGPGGILQLPSLSGKGIVELSNLNCYQQHALHTIVRSKKGKIICAHIDGNIVDIKNRTAKFSFYGFQSFYKNLIPILNCFTSDHIFNENVVY